MSFNTKRFSRLLQQDLLINRTKYLLTVFGLVLITYVLTYWFLDSNKERMIRDVNYLKQNYIICFVFFMMAVGVVIGTAFPDLTDKIKKSNYLLNPGSTLEKLLVQFLIRIGFFVPIALTIFWIAIRLAKASLIKEKSGLDPALMPYFEYITLISHPTRGLWETWQILFTFFGAFSYGIYLFAGTTIFKNYALIKTVIGSVILLFISVSFSSGLSHIFYPKTSGFGNLLQEYQVTEDLSNLEFFLLGLSLVSWVFFLAFAYFKLKEKEV